MMKSFAEIGLIPTPISKVKSRKDVNPFTSEGKLPIFVAPMTCILDATNWETFNSSKVIPIYPVKYEDYTRLSGTISDGWRAMTLVEFKHFFNACQADENVPEGYYKILIDCANGHMEELYSCVYDAKQEYGNKLVVMIGNIANPATYFNCCKSRVDYVRVGIGGGSGCTTSVQTGFHASLPWLIQEISALKKTLDVYDSNPDIPQDLKTYGFRTKIIADGGINTIDKAIKALALGADYVMMGKMFAQCTESCGALRVGDVLKDGDIKETPTFFKQYYGQSSKQGQLDRFGVIKSNPEGSGTYVEVLYTLNEFTDKLEAVLRSAMSYAGAFTLDEFIGKVRFEDQSAFEFKNYIK